MVIILSIFVCIGGYFIFRYFSLCYAIRQIVKELQDIQKDLTGNQSLHLPLPNQHLSRLLAAFNATLDNIRKERITYEKREAAFQQQIENISHDIRTPLTVISGYLRLMEKSPQIQSTKDLKEMVGIMQHKADGMKSLVEQFYDYSRLAADDYEVPLAPCDITRLTRESLLGSYQLFEQAKLKIEVALPDKPIWVIGNVIAYERIFLNLYQNVERYASTYLRISLEDQPDNVVLSFTNDTDKLTEEDISHLFDRFYMQDSSRSQGGSGLGLTVAKSLAEQLNADMDVRLGDKVESKNTLTVCFRIRMKKV